jgi:hypothetical protein
MDSVPFLAIPGFTPHVIQIHSSQSTDLENLTDWKPQIV